MDVRIKYTDAFICEKADSINEEDHSINFIISSDGVDRDKEIVTVDAVANAISSFSRNPVALACHKHQLANGDPPAVGSWNTDTFKAFKSRSEMRLFFDFENDLGGKYWKSYSKKHMRAVSLGFLVLDGHWDTVKNEKVFVITKIELFEISCVAVGACRDALTKSGLEFTANNSDTKDDRFKNLELTLKKSFDDQLTELTDNLTAQIDEIKDLLIADPEGLAKLETLGIKPKPSGDGSDKLSAEQDILTKILKLLKDHGESNG